MLSLQVLRHLRFFRFNREASVGSKLKTKQKGGNSQNKSDLNQRSCDFDQQNCHWSQQTCYFNRHNLVFPSNKTGISRNKNGNLRNQNETFTNKHVDVNQQQRKFTNNQESVISPLITYKTYFKKKMSNKNGGVLFRDTTCRPVVRSRYTWGSRQSTKNASLPVCWSRGCAGRERSAQEP